MFPFAGKRFLTALALAFVALAARGEDLTPPIASYRINCRLDTEKKTVEGTEVLTWKNTTSRPADTLQFHLYLNAFRNTRSTFMRESAGVSHGQRMAPGGWGAETISRMIGADGTDLAANLRFIAPDDGNTDDRTVAEIPLPKPVAPGETFTATIDFVSRLPRVFARSGYKGDFFFVAQWFPKIGVFTDAGWNCHQYHAHSEFFADFGDYDVEIDVPATDRGKVGATGELVEERDAPGGRLIEHFRQESVHDFAWTADPDYLVLTDRFAENGLPQVALTLLLQPEHRLQADRYFRAAKVALAGFGRRFGPYPYKTLTIVDPPWGARGAGGMEYPTLISCGTSLFAPRDVLSPEGVTVHEFGHQYFYGLLASNEFEEAWLDEGFNSWATAEVLTEAYGTTHPVLSVFGYPIVFHSIPILPLDLRRSYFALASKDVLATPSWKFESAATYGLVYSKTAYTLATLERLMGAGVMARVMRAYCDRFRFRHPTTRDFIETVNQVTGRNWDWFFDQTFFSSGTVDYAVERASCIPSPPELGLIEESGRNVEQTRATAPPAKGWRTEVVVERRGEVSLPVDILLRFVGGATYRTTWPGKGRWVKFRVADGPRLAEVIVDPDQKLLLDTDRNNNAYRVRSDAAAANFWTARAIFWMENVFGLFTELW
jgi:Peptidase family M1 domain